MSRNRSGPSSIPPIVNFQCNNKIPSADVPTILPTELAALYPETTTLFFAEPAVLDPAHDERVRTEEVAPDEEAIVAAVELVEDDEAREDGEDMTMDFVLKR